MADRRLTIGALSSRPKVLEAMTEYDDLGAGEFLARYGYGPSRRYRIRHEGRLYDSKAIAGVAWGLQHFGDGNRRPDSYSGGARSSVPTLRKLDFEVLADTPVGPGRRRSSFRPRPFDPGRTPAQRRRSAPSDPDAQKVAAEQADRAHQAALRSCGLWLQANGWSRLEEFDGAIDLMAHSRGRRVLFEIKSIRGRTERARVRSGLAQLLEYRFFLGRPGYHLCLVSNRPISGPRLRLLDSLSIAHLHVERGVVRVGDTDASRNLFP